MNYKRPAFEVRFTEEAIEELAEIYDYISEELNEIEPAKKLIKQINEKVFISRIIYRKRNFLNKLYKF